MNVPTGWKLVPEEPTPAMIEAAGLALHQTAAAVETRGDFGPVLVLASVVKPAIAVWNDMLAAVPSAPAQEEKKP